MPFEEDDVTHLGITDDDGVLVGEVGLTADHPAFTDIRDLSLAGDEI